MSRHEKRLKKMASRPIPSDIKWSDLQGMLISMGYESVKCGKTGGSRRKFFNKEKNSLILCHEPHNPAVVDKGCVKDVVQILKEVGLV